MPGMSVSPIATPRETLRVSVLLVRAVRLYGQHLRSLLGAAAVALLPLLGASISLFWHFGQFRLGFLLTAGYLMMLLALTHHAAGIVRGEAPVAGEGAGRAWHCLLPYIALLLLQVTASSIVIVVMLVPTLFTAIVLGTASHLFNGTDGELPEPLLIGLGLTTMLLAAVLMLVPLGYLFARWLVALPLLVADNCGPLAALKRSWNLTQHKVWQAAGLLTCLVILGLLAIAVPGISGYRLMSAAPVEGGGRVGGLVAAVLGAYLWLPLQVTLVMLWYRALVPAQPPPADDRRMSL